MNPLVLPANLQHRFYRGGGRIAALRGIDITDDHVPEDWVGATNGTFAEPADGPSRLEDGRLLADAIAAAPEAFLGAEHVARFGPDPALLVKLLDAGERLPVHFHPGRAFASRELAAAHGKTEAWIIVEAEPGAEVHLGFREAVDPADVRAWVDAQDGEAMLAALRPRPVAAGDAILVPAGTVARDRGGDPARRAAGADRLLDPDGGGALRPGRRSRGPPRAGLGPRAGGAGHRRVAGRRRPRPTARTGCSAPTPTRTSARERLSGGAELDAGFAILVALAGEGTLSTEAGGELELVRGETVLVPYAAGAGRLEGSLTVLRCRPPDPAAGEGAW